MEKLKSFFAKYQLGDIYDNQIFPAIQDIEKKINRNIQIRRRKLFVLLLVPYLVVYYLKVDVMKESGLANIILVIVCTVLIAVPSINSNIKNKLAKIYKAKIIFPFLQSQFTRFVYKPKQFFGKKSICKSLLVRDVIDRVEGEDFFRFYIDDIMMQFSEVKILQTVGLFGGSTILTNGIFLSVDFPKEFTTRLVVLNERDVFSKIKKVYRPTPVIGQEKIELRRMEFETGEFEDEFVVYGDDEIAARFILSTGIMQRFVDYQKKIGYPFSFSFVDNRLYMNIDSYRNLFDPNIKSIDKFRQGLMDDLTLINDLVSIIQDLNLEVNIWKG